MFQLKPPSIKYEDEVFYEINRNHTETSAVGEILTDKTITRDAIHIKKRNINLGGVRGELNWYHLNYFALKGDIRVDSDKTESCIWTG